MEHKRKKKSSDGQIMKEKKKKKSRVRPSSSDEQLDHAYGNSSFELDFLSDLAKNKSLNNFRNIINDTRHKATTLEAMTLAKASGSKWRKYRSSRRIGKEGGAHGHGKVGMREGNSNKETLGLDNILHKTLSKNVLSSPLDTSRGEATSQMTTASNQMLLQYFSELGKTKSKDVVNLDFVETLLKNGASIDCCDQFGQSLLHEVARFWHVDVAKFLLEHGANINMKDYMGRTPLHYAAADDYADMVNFLIEREADKEARTIGEDQTPIHYAAKKDACKSLRALIKNGCEYREVRDYKGRTPLHIAAELDRSETARLLLELDVPASLSDNSGQKTLTWLITKMPPVAMEALNQLHTSNRQSRKQYFYLNLLMQDREKDSKNLTYTPLQVAVNFKQYDLLMHKVFLCLIEKMWMKFTRVRAWMNLIQNFLCIFLWSVFGVTIPYDEKYLYRMPDHWWRVVILVLAILLTVWQMIEEVVEYHRSQSAFKRWKSWRESEIEKDLQYCHDRWPEEKEYLDWEISLLDDASPKYLKDYWNVFDWICYILLIGCVVTHVVDIYAHSLDLAIVHNRLMAITIIVLWLRLMKNARPFALIGPFIVMLGHMLTDLVRFVFLYLEFFLPYVCAFWMIFGGTKMVYEDATVSNVTVGGFVSFGDVFFSLFRLTLVDEYDYGNMKLVDPFMADLLVGTWLALSAIMCLNLFIALLSDTFQRVYDNAQANAVMQKAITVLHIWDSMSNNKRQTFLTYIKDKCSPKEEDYDDDITVASEEDLKKVTVQIKDQLDEMQEQWNYKFGQHDREDELLEGPSDDNGGGSVDETHVTREKFENECSNLQENIAELRESQDEMRVQFKEDMDTIKSLLLEITGRGGGGGQGTGTRDDRVDRDPHTRHSYRRKKSSSKAHTEVELPRPHEAVDDPSIDFFAGTVPQITRTAGSIRPPQDSDSNAFSDSNA